MKMGCVSVVNAWKTNIVVIRQALFIRGIMTRAESARVQLPRARAEFSLEFEVFYS